MHVRSACLLDIRSLNRVFQNISQIISYLLWALKFAVFENFFKSLRELLRLPFELRLQPVFDLAIAGSNTLTLILNRVLPSPSGDQGARLPLSLLTQLPSQTDVFKEICK